MYAWATSIGANPFVLVTERWGLYDFLDRHSKLMEMRRSRVKASTKGMKLSPDMQRQLDCIVRCVPQDSMDFCFQMFLAYQGLPPEERERREQLVRTLIDERFEDIRSPSDELKAELEDMKILACFHPTAVQETRVKMSCATIRSHLLAEKKDSQGQATYKNIPQPAEYKSKTVFFTLVDTQLGGPNPDEKTRTDMSAVKRQLTYLLTYVPARDFDTLRQQVERVISNERTKIALVKAAVPLHALSMVANYRPLGLQRILQELADHPDQDGDDFINLQLAQTMADSDVEYYRLAHDTIEAIDKGVNMGAARTASSQQALEKLRQTSAATDLRVFLARKTPAAQSEDNPGLWSVNQLARWIGPVTMKKGSKGIDSQAINKRLQQEQQALKSSAQTKGEKSAPPPKIDVDAVIKEALSNTAAFFLGDLMDLLHRAKALETDPNIREAGQALLPPLKDLTAQVKHVGEARKLLTEAEALLQTLRFSLKRAEASALVQQRFPGQLSLSLRNEPMVMGQRKGGVIDCRVAPEDWSYVAHAFHNRWLPQFKSIQVAGESMPLNEDEALALYVTGSSQSGFAFDVTVHLWRRHADCHGTPSREHGLFPPMNEDEWFDTYVTCCVLHVPPAV